MADILGEYIRLGYYPKQLRLCMSASEGGILLQCEGSCDGGISLQCLKVFAHSPVSLVIDPGA